MLALIFQIIFSSAFTLLIKWGQVRKKEDVLTFGAINYIVAALLILPVFLMNRPEKLSVGAIYAGSSMGLIYFVAYFLAVSAIRRVGAASASVVSVLSILFPIVLFAVFFNEQPNLTQIIGISLALSALTLISAQKPAKQDLSYQVAGRTEVEAGPRWTVPLILFSFFLLCGLSRVAQEAFKHLVELEHQAEQRPTFLLSAFGMAALPSVAMLLFRRKNIQPMEFGVGFAMGLSNILQTFFILQALEFFAGFIVFPISSAGGVVLVTIVATRLLGERLNGRTYVGILLSVIALFLLNSSG